MLLLIAITTGLLASLGTGVLFLAIHQGHAKASYPALCRIPEGRKRLQEWGAILATAMTVWVAMVICFASISPLSFLSWFYMLLLPAYLLLMASVYKFGTRGLSLTLGEFKPE